MNMNKKVIASFLFLPALLMTACSSSETEEEQAVVAVADDPSFDMKGTPTKAPNALADGVVEVTEKELADMKPVDKGLEIALPSLESYEVQRNETIRITAPGTDPKAVFDAFIYYNDKGSNSATLNLGEFKPEKAGGVVAEVTIPKNIEPGKYVIALDAGSGIYSSQIEVK